MSAKPANKSSHFLNTHRVKARRAIATGAKILSFSRRRCHHHLAANCARAASARVLDLRLAQIARFLRIFLLDLAQKNLMLILKLARLGHAKILSFSRRRNRHYLAVFSSALAKRVLLVFINHAWCGKDLNRVQRARRDAVFFDLARTNSAKILDLTLLSRHMLAPKIQILSPLAPLAFKGYSHE